MFCRPRQGGASVARRIASGTTPQGPAAILCFVQQLKRQQSKEIVAQFNAEHLAFSSRAPAIETKHPQHMLHFQLLQFMLYYIYNSKGSCDMPKCAPDPALQERVHRFMRENGLTVSGAATKLGVDRTTFWRFCDSGRARGDTRASYSAALEKRNKNNKETVADDAVKADALTARTRTSLQGGLAGHELKLIRKACEGVLLLLDAYEAQALGRDI